MRHTVLQVMPLLPWLQEQLDATYDVALLPSDPAEQAAFLAARAGDFEALITNAAVGVGNDLVDALPNLRVISSFGVGLDRLDAAHAAKRGIPIGYTPDVLNDCVADLAFGLLLDVARGLSHGDRYVRAGRWVQQAPVGLPMGRQVSHARLGIVGLGRIGRTIARRASGFEMDVRYHSRRPVADVPWTHEPTLTGLAQWCDFLVVITAGGEGTRHLVNDTVLDALGPKGYLINVSRGTVVDEAALVRALQERRIAGAALDVFENEPRVPEALWSLDNVVLVPHIASATVQTRQAMGQRVLDNLAAFFAGQPLPSAAPVG
ncbi:2-hydroxyacid dehydrogenase [Ramlibacter sp.]|uniref:2-hydroxyacid dehydrogenase n=1 Tax=Ramlibacter sp. TaxID=1917967 RepID=UPI0035AE9599